MYFSNIQNYVLLVKAKLGGGGASKKSTTKGVEYDAMGTKWNKAMWDNMESKNKCWISLKIY